MLDGPGTHAGAVTRAAGAGVSASGVGSQGRSLAALDHADEVAPVGQFAGGDLGRAVPERLGARLLDWLLRQDGP